MINIPNEGLIFDLFYGGKAPGEGDGYNNPTEQKIPAVTEETPAFRDIFIKNVTAKNVGVLSCSTVCRKCLSRISTSKT